MQRTTIRLIACLATVSLVLVNAGGVSRAEPIGDTHFERTWERTDQPVANHQVNRTWMWGPEPFSHVFQEPYTDAAGGTRLVQYFDKSRMEITDPDAVDDGVWYVTNGLLATELLTGNLQRGDNQFAARTPAEINLAGDPDDPQGITYAGLAPGIAGFPDDPVYTRGQVVIHRLEWSDNTPSPSRYLLPVPQDELADYGAAVAAYVPETGKWIAGPFWEFMNASGLVQEDGRLIEDRLFVNPYYATGYPVTNPYWARVTVAGTPKDVLLQCFERRCLTFTPDNPSGWQVEAGNVGQHYYRWRYGDAQPGSLYDYASSFGDHWDPGTAMQFVADMVVTDIGEVLILESEIAYSNDSSPRIQRFSPDGYFIDQWGDSGEEPGQFIDPQALAQDSDGNLYVADTGNHRVQVFSADGRFLAQWGPRGDFKPSDISISGQGDVYVLDHAHGWLSRFDVSGSLLGGWEVQGGSIAADAEGNLYVAGTTLRKYDIAGRLLAEWGGPDSAVPLHNLRSVALDQEGNVALIDRRPVDPSGSHSIFLRLSANGVLLDEWSPVDGTAMTFDRNGNVLLTAGQSGVIMYSATGVLIDRWIGSGRGKLASPLGVAIDHDGNVLVGDSSGQVLVYDARGTYRKSWGWLEGVGLPQDIAVGIDGAVYVLDNIGRQNARVVKIGSSDGGYVTSWHVDPPGEGKPQQAYEPTLATGIATDSDGYVFVTAYSLQTLPHGQYRISGSAIQRYSGDGTLLDEWNADPLPTGGFDVYQGIAVSSTRIYATVAGSIRVFDHSGVLLDVWSLPLGYLGAIGLGPDGAIFVTTDGPNRIVELNLDGTIVASSNSMDDATDPLTGINGIAVDVAGNVFVTDTSNVETGHAGLVRKFVPVP